MIHSVLFEKYRIERKLGDGASASVYLVEHISLKTYRALKCIKKANSLGVDASKEAHILKHLQHPNIPLIYDIEEDETYFYIIEEYIPGESLKSFRQKTTFLQEETVLNYAVQICELVKYLHSMANPVLYLDLKPENIIVNDHRLKLVDFGAAIYREEGGGRKRIGTKGYASPEQYRIGYIDERSDLYSIGMLIFYLVTGCTFLGKSTYLANIDEAGNCSGQLKKILNRCLNYHPSLRYRSVEQLYSKLTHCQKESRIQGESMPKYPFTVGVAGAQERIGATHVALLLAACINRYHRPCLYVEKDKSGTTHMIWSRYSMNNGNDLVFRIRDCMLFLGGAKECIPSGMVQVLDYGLYSHDVQKEMNKHDVQVLILGAKEWELPHTEQIIRATMEEETLLYGFNFVDGYLFREIQKNMNGRESYRIPYAYDPFSAIKNECIQELAEEIIRKGAQGETRTKTNAD